MLRRTGTRGASRGNWSKVGSPRRRHEQCFRQTRQVNHTAESFRPSNSSCPKRAHSSSSLGVTMGVTSRFRLLGGMLLVGSGGGGIPVVAGGAIDAEAVGGGGAMGSSSSVEDGGGGSSEGSSRKLLSNGVGAALVIVLLAIVHMVPKRITNQSNLTSTRMARISTRRAAKSPVLSARRHGRRSIDEKVSGAGCARSLGTASSDQMCPKSALYEQHRDPS